MTEPADRRSPPEPLAEFGRVAGELVHDLANDLQVLQGWAALARVEAEVGSVPITDLDRLSRISETLGQMLQDVLATVAGLDLSPEVNFDPHALTITTVNDRMRELSFNDVRLFSALPGEVRVHGRASFWVRTLMNLLRNACRHARSKVHVRLTLDHGADGEEVVLRVEDDGPGVPPESRTLIFEALWRGEGGNMGFGLSSVAWSVQQLGGSVRYLEGAPLGGAAFEVRVPAARAVIATGGASVETLALKSQRLLLVDDEPAIRFAVARLLRRAGAEVREIDPNSLPEEALVKEILTAAPDVILMDLHLRERGGLSLWDRIQANLPTLAGRVLFITGAARGDTAWSEAEHTGQPVLSKPFNLRQLVDALGKLGTRS